MIPVYTESPDRHSKLVLDTLLPNVGLEYNADLTAALFASQVACNTDLDVSVYDFINEKFLLYSKSVDKQQIKSNSVTSDIEPS